MKRDVNEKEILESVERGEWRSVTGAKRNRSRYARYAAATLMAMRESTANDRKRYAKARARGLTGKRRRTASRQQRRQSSTPRMLDFFRWLSRLRWRS